MLRPASLLFIAIVVLTLNARGQASDVPPLTAKEAAQGYRDVYVLAKPRAGSLATVDAAESAEGWTVRRKFARFGGLRVIAVDAGTTAQEATRRLRASGRYEFVELDFIKRARAVPSDPDFTQQWGLNNAGNNPNVPGPGIAGADIHAETAWQTRTSAPGVIVAVIDSGAWLTHTDLVANLWQNPQENKDIVVNGVTYADNDLNGINTTVSPTTSSRSGVQANTAYGSPNDDNGHGTHVSGIIGAVGNNGVDTCGVAWSVQLMELKFLDSTGEGDTVNEITCIDYAISHGANVVNASFGDSSYSFSEYTAIQQLQASGIIFVAAAGNGAEDNGLTVNYPADYPLDNIVTVACSDNRDDSVYFTNYSSGSVDLYAPGYEILSLYNTSNTATAVLSGTSMSTPFVTGSLALLKAQFPDDTYRQLINRVLRTVDQNANFTGKAQTGGRLDLAAAITLGPTVNGPFNDLFASRGHLAGAALNVRSNNAGATREAGEPLIAGNPGGASLWWDWTAPASGTVAIATTGSAYPTLLAVYTDPSATLAGLVPLASAAATGNGASSVSFAVQAGTTYFISVDGQNGATGQTLFSLAYANGAFATPITVTGTSASITASNIASISPAALNRLADYLVWFAWTAPKSAQFQISAYSYDFDPRLTVYAGASQGSPQIAQSTAGAINANASAAATSCTCTFNATAGTTYMLAVDGFGDANSLNGPMDVNGNSVGGGQFTLSIIDSRWQAATDDSLTCSPAVGTDGTIYVGSDNGTFYAFNPDGTTKWTYAAGPAGYFDTAAAAVSADGTAVYAGSGNGTLYAFKTTTGGVLWSYAVATSPPACSPAIGADGTIYIRDSGSNLYALNSNGTLKWTFGVSGLSYAAPAIAPDGTVYIGSDNGTLYALTPGASSAIQKWTFNTDPSSVPGNAIYNAPAIDASGNIYFGTLSGMFYAVSPAGNPLWSYQAGNSISSSPALGGSNGTVYFGCYDHNVYALSTATGALQWTYPTGNEIRASSPAIDGNGVIYVGCYDNRVYAINPNGTLNRIAGVGDWVRSSPAIFGTTLYFGSNDHKLTALDIGAGSSGSPWPMYMYNSRRIGRAVTDSLAITVQPAASVSVAQGSPLTLAVAAVGQGPLSFQWYLNGAAISGATNSTYTVSSAIVGNAGAYTVDVSGPQGSVTSSASAVAIVAPVAITAQPQSQTIVSGTTVVFSVSAIGTTTPTLQWYLNGTAITGATSARLVISGATAANAGSYTCVATNAAGTATSNAAVLTLTSTTNVGRLTNLSVNAVAGSGNQLMTVGFVTGGGGTSGSQSLLIRASGPALVPYGVTGTLPDPQLTVFNSADTSIASNAGWGTPASNVALVEAAETNTQAGLVYGSTSSLDSATVQTLGSGAYTVQVSGKSGDSGRTLAEVYDDTTANTYTLGTPRLINVSCRIQVSAGSSLTEGFIIGGTTSKTVLIRAIGPGLTQYGISGVMPDPQLMIYNSADTVIASNVGWGGDPQLTTVMNAVGSQPNPPASADSVALLTLAPGSYTAVAQSASGTAGDVLVDIYEVP